MLLALSGSPSVMSGPVAGRRPAARRRRALDNTKDQLRSGRRGRPSVGGWSIRTRARARDLDVAGRSLAHRRPVPGEWRCAAGWSPSAVRRCPQAQVLAVGSALTCTRSRRLPPGGRSLFVPYSAHDIRPDGATSVRGVDRKQVRSNNGDPLLAGGEAGVNVENLGTSGAPDPGLPSERLSPSEPVCPGRQCKTGGRLRRLHEASTLSPATDSEVGHGDRSKINGPRTQRPVRDDVPRHDAQSSGVRTCIRPLGDPHCLRRRRSRSHPVTS